MLGTSFAPGDPLQRTPKIVARRLALAATKAGVDLSKTVTLSKPAATLLRLTSSGPERSSGSPGRRARYQAGVSLRAVFSASDEDKEERRMQGASAAYARF